MNNVKKNAARLEEKKKSKNRILRESSIEKAIAVNNLVLLHMQAWLTVCDAEEGFIALHVRKVHQAQLDFYLYIMNATCPEKLYYKIKYHANKRVDLTLEELFENLKTVITAFQLLLTYCKRNCELKDKGDSYQ